MNKLSGAAFAAIVGSIATSAALHVTPAFAQQEAEAVLEEVFVTSQRREQSVIDVPISITTFTATTIEANMIQNVVDYFARSPNLTISSAATRSGNVSASSSGLAIRGISNVGGDALSYGFYIDDFNVTQATVNPQLVDMQRIEILRGPQGTFFGRNASAGVISLTTNKPNEHLEGKTAVELSSFSSWEAVGTVNVPVSDTFMLRQVPNMLKVMTTPKITMQLAAVTAIRMNFCGWPHEYCPRIAGQLI